MRGGFLLIAACLAGCSAAPAAPAWQRVWTVARVICPSCDTATRAALEKDVGARITIARDRFLNPLYESCPRGVDYSALRPADAAAAKAAMPGLPPIAAERVISGTVGCALASGPPNTIARFVFDGPTGYYLFEGGAILELR